MTRDPRARWNDREPEDDALEAFFKRSSSDPSAAMDCPPPEHIQAARMELLPPAAQEAVARHLAGCAVCNALGDALDDRRVCTHGFARRSHKGAAPPTLERRGDGRPSPLLF